jgi:hypothetical protein
MLSAVNMINSSGATMTGATGAPVNSASAV